MSISWKEKAVTGLKKTWRCTRSLTVNTGRRAQILGLHGQGWWQQRKIKQALTNLGAKTFQALEQGESNPLTAAEVNQAVDRVRRLKENQIRNCQAIDAIRERIRISRILPTPEEACPSEPPDAS